MSERNVKLFYNEMCKNEKLQNEIQEVLSGAKTESDKQALLNDIAKKYHFDFTPEEAKKFAENLSKNKLNLDDLSEVSGGIGKRTAVLAFTALTALGSLGSAGAIISHAAGSGDGQTPSSSTDTTKEENNQNQEVNDQNTEEIYNMYKSLDEETKNYINKYDYYAEYANKFEELVKFKELVNELEKELENEETKEETKLKYESIIDLYYDFYDRLDEYKFNLKFIKDKNIKNYLSRIKKDVEKQVRKDNDDHINITSLNTRLEARTKRVQREIYDKIYSMDSTVEIYNDLINKKKEIDEKNQKKNYGDRNFLFTASSNIKLPEENEEIIKQKNDKSQENMDNKEKNGAKGTIENQEHINNSKILKDKIKEVKQFCENNNINDGNIYKEIDNLLKSIEFNLQIGETYESSKNNLNKIIEYVILKNKINEVKQFCENNNINDGKIHKEIDDLLKSIDSNLQIGKTYESSKNNLNKIIADVNNKYYATRQAEVKKEKKLNSKIINEDNKNVFENLVCPTENLKLLYRFTEYGSSTKMQNKLKGLSNIVILVKTIEKKVFGGYIRCKIECNNKWKRDNKAFLFSLDLNKKFNIKENEEAIYDTDSEGISFGYSDLVLFNKDDLCYSYFGNESPYENNGITINEFIGGLEKTDTIGLKYNIFAPTEIEVFEIKDIKKFEEERRRKEEEERIRREEEERRRKEKEERRRKEEEERHKKEEEERHKKEEEINKFVENVKNSINETKEIPESDIKDIRKKYNKYSRITSYINYLTSDRNINLNKDTKILLNKYNEFVSNQLKRLGDMLRKNK